MYEQAVGVVKAGRRYIKRSFHSVFSAMVSTYMKSFLHPALLYTIFVHIVVPGKLTCIKFASLLGSSRQNHENCSIEDCAVLSTTYWCCIYQANNDSQDGFSNCTVRLAVQMTP